MSIVNKSSLLSLDYVFNGQPFVQVEAQTLNTQSLNITYLGQPFVGAFDDIVPTDSNVYVKVDGQWKQATAIYVNINGQWEQVINDSFYVNINSVWRQ